MYSMLKYPYFEQMFSIGFQLNKIITFDTVALFQDFSVEIGTALFKIYDVHVDVDINVPSSAYYGNVFYNYMT